jgi:hypothetical protein
MIISDFAGIDLSNQFLVHSISKHTEFVCSQLLDISVHLFLPLLITGNLKNREPVSLQPTPINQI